jgi:hypothetical protein
MITPKPVESYVLPPDLVAFAILVRIWYGIVMVLPQSMLSPCQRSEAQFCYCKETVRIGGT